MHLMQKVSRAWFNLPLGLGASLQVSVHAHENNCRNMMRSQSFQNIVIVSYDVIVQNLDGMVLHAGRSTDGVVFLVGICRLAIE